MGRREDLGVLHSLAYGKFSNGGSVTSELVRVKDVWHVVIDQEAFKEGPGGMVFRWVCKRMASAVPVSSTACRHQCFLPLFRVHTSFSHHREQRRPSQ